MVYQGRPIIPHAEPELRAEADGPHLPAAQRTESHRTQPERNPRQAAALGLPRRGSTDGPGGAERARGGERCAEPDGRPWRTERFGQGGVSSGAVRDLIRGLRAAAVEGRCRDAAREGERCRRNRGHCTLPAQAWQDKWTRLRRLSTELRLAVEALRLSKRSLGALSTSLFASVTLRS